MSFKTAPYVCGPAFSAVELPNAKGNPSGSFVISINGKHSGQTYPSYGEAFNAAWQASRHIGTKRDIPNEKVFSDAVEG